MMRIPPRARESAVRRFDGFHLAPAAVGLLGILAMGCQRSSQAPGTQPPEGRGATSPLPRSVRVEPDSVAVEGRWVPIEAGVAATPNAVRVVCSRAERACNEDLARQSSAGGADVRETWKYRVEEWTKWGTPAGKLTASRREGAVEIEIRVSLSGLAAEKVVIDKGRETRWRIE